MGMTLSIFYWPIIFLSSIFGYLIDKFGIFLFFNNNLKEAEMGFYFVLFLIWLEVLYLLLEFEKLILQ